MTFDKNADYCTLSPDHFFKWNWKKCCYLHDKQYWNEVKNRKTRKEADRDLRDCMLKELPIYLFFIAWIYYFSVRIFVGRWWAK